MISVRDSVIQVIRMDVTNNWKKCQTLLSFQECLQFLDHCEIYGKNVKTILEQPLEEVRIHRGKNTATYEARYLKALILKLQME